MNHPHFIAGRAFYLTLIAPGNLPGPVGPAGRPMFRVWYCLDCIDVWWTKTVIRSLLANHPDGRRVNFSAPSSQRSRIIVFVATLPASPSATTKPTTKPTGLYGRLLLDGVLWQEEMGEGSRRCLGGPFAITYQRE